MHSESLKVYYDIMPMKCMLYFVVLCSVDPFPTRALYTVSGRF